MNEVRNASMVGLERCKSCSYFTPKRQPVCANCGASTRGPSDDQPTVTPDQPEVTPSAEAAGPADEPNGPDAAEPAESGGGRSKVVVGAIAAVVVLAALGAGIVALSSRGEQAPQPATPGPVTSLPVVESSTTTAAPATTARPSTTAASSTTAATDALACGRWQDLRYVAKNRPTDRAAEIAERAKGMEEAAATEKLRAATRALAAAAEGHDLNALAAAATAIDEACS